MAIQNGGRRFRRLLLWLIAGWLLGSLPGCRQEGSDTGLTGPTLLHRLAADETGVGFRNDLPENEATNPLVYEYTYNGGGVAADDLNGDGLDDLYFTANQGPNRLHLNRTAPGANPAIHFDDITDAAGVADADNWKTGVTMADVNGDGRLDLYVCHSGNLAPERRLNRLFINQGNDKQGVPRFRDEAARFGLADSAFSTQAAFFDFDHDHDLDMLLINHSPRRFENLDETGIERIMNTPDQLTGVKLYRNDNNHFADVTRDVGLRNARLSYGLGVSVADVNNDGWPDIYLSNDYLAPDYLYINQGGHFTDQTDAALGHTSQFSMGNDIADINNDGWSDIFTMDMLPEDNHRQKLLFANDNYELFALRERTGLHRQYMRNMLHLNQGATGSKTPVFAEIGQQAGMSNTDWSWAPLAADLDNDGWKDLIITNGYVHDYTNMDFLKYMGDFVKASNGNIQRSNLLDLVRQMPSSNVINYVFHNNAGRSTTDTAGQDNLFSNVSRAWGFDTPSNSNGAAYTDLDNDGDLDVVINNINKEAFVYRNDADQLLHHNTLAVKLDGTGANRYGVGASVMLYSRGTVQRQEQLLCRGFQSSVSPVLHFGLGTSKTIDSLRVTWPGGQTQWVRNVPANQTLTLHEKDAGQRQATQSVASQQAIFQAVTAPVSGTASENDVNDFKRQPLLTNSLSYSGPCVVKGDVNGDGVENLFVGGASGYAGRVLVQRAGRFVDTRQPALIADYLQEDTDAAFLDADRDGDLDLYVCSGGYDNFLPNDALLQDRLYINDGRGQFTRQPDALPRMYTSKSCVRVADINADGHPDLFVGGRVVPARYPETPDSYILLNDGRGHFSDATSRVAPALKKLGMVADAAWADMNADGRPDLITAGEWLPVQVWINQNGQLVDKTTDYLPRLSGWWNKLLVTDLNGDGRPDIVAGNMGLNTQCRASVGQPAELVYKDFDDNGTIDPILTMPIQGSLYPFVSRDELLDQMTTMRPRFTDYKSYADAVLTDVLTPDERAGATTLRADRLQTTVFISGPAGKKYQLARLPAEAQYTPVFAITTTDYNGDGHPDLLLGGNITHSRIRFGNNDAGLGLLLRGDGKGNFTTVSQAQSGLAIRGDIRSFTWLNGLLLAGVNNQPFLAFKRNKN